MTLHRTEIEKMATPETHHTTDYSGSNTAVLDDRDDCKSYIELAPMGFSHGHMHQTYRPFETTPLEVLDLDP